MKCSYEQFEKEFGYEFKDKSLLKKAFTHTTYVFEHKGKHYDSNQCLEFIGDGVLDCVIGRLIFEKKPYEDEGYLSKTRSLIVCEKSLAKVARKLHMGELLLLGKGETSTGGADKDSTLADAFESVIAAVFVDSCYEEAKRVIISNLSEIIDDALEGRLFLDYKSKLLELAQRKKNQHQVCPAECHGQKDLAAFRISLHAVHFNDTGIRILLNPFLEVLVVMTFPVGAVFSA